MAKHWLTGATIASKADRGVTVRNVRQAPPNDQVAAVLAKQNELFEQFLVRGTKELEGGRRYDRLYGEVVSHPTMPLQYDPISLKRLVGPHIRRDVDRLEKDQREKHTLHTLAPVSPDHHPFYELGWFQDCALDRQFMSLLIQPQNSIVNLIPVRPNNTINQKFPFLTKYTVDEVAGQTEPATACEGCIQITEALDACRISFPYGRLCRGGKTLESNELIRKACNREYDDFLFDGDLMGVGAPFVPFQSNAADHTNVFQWAAIKRQFFNLARYYQLWLMSKVWTADPVNNIGTGYKEFYGLLRLITDDYDTNTLPVESFDGNRGDCALLNSDIKDFGGRCISDGTTPNIYEVMQELESTLYLRANAIGALPVQWIWFMISPLWYELCKVLPYLMAHDSFTVTNPAVTGQIALNNGNSLFGLSMRQQLMNTMTIPLNGRNVPIRIEDNLPYTHPTATKYTSDIFVIPFTANGTEVLYWEHMDYSELDRQFAGLPGSATDMLGWTDGGRFHHSLTMERHCFEIQTKFEPRLIFLAPHLAGRIQNVCCNTLQQKPMVFDGQGNYAPTLGN